MRFIELKLVMIDSTAGLYLSSISLAKKGEEALADLINVKSMMQRTLVYSRRSTHIL